MNDRGRIYDGYSGRGGQRQPERGSGDRRYDERRNDGYRGERRGGYDRRPDGYYPDDGRGYEPRSEGYGGRRRDADTPDGAERYSKGSRSDRYGGRREEYASDDRWENGGGRKGPGPEKVGEKGGGWMTKLPGALAMCAAAVCFALIFTSEGLIRDTAPVAAKDMMSDIYSASDRIKADALTDSGLYQMERKKVLQWNELPAPAPNYDDFSITIGEKDNRASEWGYRDSTITVKGWTERIAGCKVYFSDIVIAHPTQLRTALANGKFPASAYPSDMAKSVNAVIATNGDFSGYRESGMIIRQGVCYRVKKYDKLTWDVLLIDDKGDFHITDDRKIDEASFRDRVYTENGVDYNIVNTMHFGPSLVVNGEKKILHMQSGCGNEVNETYKRSHTAIGQLGELHYLMCCVEETDNGMKPESFGTNIPTMADIMFDKGCVQAYNLDGGQSTTLVFGNKTLNFVNRGGERELSEIIYFASAENLE